MRTLIFVTAVVAFAAPAAAQELVEAELRQGYYAAVSFSAGAGSIDDSDLGDLGSGLDAGGRIRFGQMFSPSWGAGFLLLGGSSAAGDFDGLGGGLGLEFNIYPFQALDLSLRPSVALQVIGLSRADNNLETSDDPASLYAARIGTTVAYDVWCWDERAESGGQCLTLGVDAALSEGDGIRGVSAVGLIGLQQFWGLVADRLR